LRVDLEDSNALCECPQETRKPRFFARPDAFQEIVPIIVLLCYIAQYT